MDDKEFYWLANNSGVKEKVTMSLRDGNGAAEIWDCETGEMKSVMYRTVNGRKVIELHFNPYEAYWLVFSSSSDIGVDDRQREVKSVEMKIDEPWK
ncbi:MAG: hypothetical protein L3J61_04545, partial [Ghiorsea sp.]|nr:hypothetical protein [Ghiorsea sp.]